MHGQEDNFRFAAKACEQAGGFETVHHRHGYIENEYVRFQGFGGLERGLAVVNRADDFELRLENAAGRLQHGIMDVPEVECVAGKGLVGDRYFGYRADYKGQVTFFEEEVVEEIRETFKVPKIGVIAGCYVRSGVINRQGRVRVVRDGIEVYEGTIGSLRRFKDDVREVKEGYECGIGIENFNDLKVGDIIETYRTEEVARTLQPASAG